MKLIPEEFPEIKESYSRKVYSMWIGSLKIKELFNFTYLLHAAAAKLLQSCPTLRDPIDGSPPGFPIPGILQEYNATNAWRSVIHLGVSNMKWGIAKDFLMWINRWFGINIAICFWASPLVSEKKKRQYLFSAVFQVNHMESKVLFQPILFVSKRGGKVPATATLATSHGTDVWKMQK